MLGGKGTGDPGRATVQCDLPHWARVRWEVRWWERTVGTRPRTFPPGGRELLKVEKALIFSWKTIK